MDNKGWSLRFMLFLTSLLILSLLIASFFVAKLSKDFSKNLKTDNTDNKYNKFEMSSDYSKIENLMDEIALDYVNEEYEEGVDNATITVQLSNLIDYDNNETISSFINKNNCDGYTNVFSENNKMNSSSYLKCSNYKTIGFSDFYLE